MEKNNLKQLREEAIKKLTQNIKNPDQLRYALFLAEDIKSAFILLEYADIACNEEVLKSKYYERILVVAARQEYIKPIKYIKTIFCNKNFLNSINCDQGLRLLEDNDPKEEYRIFFALMQTLDELDKEKVNKEPEKTI